MRWFFVAIGACEMMVQPVASSGCMFPSDAYGVELSLYYSFTASVLQLPCITNSVGEPCALPSASIICLSHMRPSC